MDRTRQKVTQYKVVNNSCIPITKPIPITSCQIPILHSQHRLTQFVAPNRLMSSSSAK